ncbi:hypothetical protein VaNZ11_006414 [Volvox africanus]|uniref:SAP domain-containing protein n=1 Tax=Volvox africanus TaxID=51714 RepID=A0ABQ5S292_9CHLO|nr:hypothetical protein VaNZ11_006414 [Volvox africanus]
MTEHYNDNIWIEENEDEEEDAQKEYRDYYKEKMIFMMDAQESMFDEIELCGETTTSFEAAHRTVVELLKLKAIQHPDDQVAVVLYNTRERDKPGGGAGAGGGGDDGFTTPFTAAFEGVRTLLELQQPSAEAVRAVRDLTADTFRRTIGSRPQRRDSALADALFRIQNCLAASRSAETSINTLVVFTNDPEPCGPSTAPGYKAALAQLNSRVEALQGYRVCLRLFPLAAAVRPFNSGRLWRSVLRALSGPAEELDGGAGGGSGGGGGGNAVSGVSGAGAGGEWVGYDEALLQELAIDPGQRRDPVTVITALFESFKRRLSRKRTLMKLNWVLSERLKVAVKGYLLVYDAAKNAKRTVYVNPVTNQPLKVISLVSTYDGRLLENEEVGKMKMFNLKTGDTSRLPEVMVPASEVSASGGAGLVPPGLMLLGFKPLSCLLPYHQMQPSIFLRPDERSAPGSTIAFISLWRAMLAEGRFALCRYRKAANTSPRLVALIPQDEGIDPYGIQTDPPGIHMIIMPYMDDIRHPETATGVAPQQPSDGQMAASKALIAALDLEKVEAFDLTQVCNPWLERHYAVVEALALSEPIPPWSAIADDGTRPRRELFESREAIEAIETFRLAFPQEGSGKGTKRKAVGEPGGGPAAVKVQKAEAVADAYSAIDWEGLYRSNGFTKLNKDDLTLYLRRHLLKVTGKKDELIQRIREHMEQIGKGPGSR